MIVVQTAVLLLTKSLSEDDSVFKDDFESEASFIYIYIYIGIDEYICIHIYTHTDR